MNFLQIDMFVGNHLFQVRVCTCLCRQCFNARLGFENLRAAFNFNDGLGLDMKKLEERVLGKRRSGEQREDSSNNLLYFLMLM